MTSLRARVSVLYGVMAGTTVAFLFWIRTHREHLATLERQVATIEVTKPDSSPMLHVLLSLAVVIVTANLLWGVFRRFGQPRVVAEVIAGIALGPSLLGRFAPDVQSFVLPRATMPFLNVVSQIGVMLFMFVVGLELDGGLLRRRSQVTLAISHASMVFPFLLGCSIAIWFYPELAPEGVSLSNFALFLGTCMSVTAFPVLARILTDRGAHRSQLGAMALSCAAVIDATAWCLLAVVVGIAEASNDKAFVTMGLAISFVILLVLVVRPLLERSLQKQELTGKTSQSTMIVTLIGLLLSALSAEAIGLHALFGAFLFGAIIPRDSRLARELTLRLEDVVVLLFLPAFFAFTGMRVRLGLLSSISDWTYCLVIIAAACAGKFGGSTAAARVMGFSWRDSFSLGVLMNTRGLMELIILDVGLDLGILSPRLYTMLVLMTVVTTLASPALLQLMSRNAGATRALEA